MEVCRRCDCFTFIVGGTAVVAAFMIGTKFGYERAEVDCVLHVSSFIGKATERHPELMQQVADNIIKELKDTRF